MKNPPANAGGMRNTSLLQGKSPGAWHGNPLQHSCLGNPMDRGDWQAMVHRTAKSQTQIKRLSMRHAKRKINKQLVAEGCGVKGCFYLFYN